MQKQGLYPTVILWVCCGYPMVRDQVWIRFDSGLAQVSIRKYKQLNIYSMKRITYFLLTATLLAISSLWSGVQATGTLAIGSNDTYSIYAPVYCNQADNMFCAQIVYPATELTALAGKQITHLTFTQKVASSSDWSNVETRIVEVAYANFGTASGSQAFESMTGVDYLHKGTWASSSSAKQVTLELSEPYVYGGGNLLIDVRKTVTGGGWSTGTSSNTTGRACATYISSAYSVLYNYSSSSFPTTGSKSMNRPDITFTYEDASAPTCPKPTALTKSSVTSSSATFTWTKGGDETSWQYVCLPAATAVDWASGDVQTATSATATVTGLSANTSYKFYVRADCGAEQSDGVSLAFKTPCSGVSSYSCGFETSEDCTNGGYPDCWSKISGSEYPQVYNYYANSGSQCLRFYKSGPQYAILPPFNKDVKNLMVSFMYRNGSYSETLQVGYMTDPEDASSFISVQELTHIADYGSEVTEVNLSGAAEGARYIAFKYICSSLWGVSYIDDLSVSDAPSCIKPSGLSAEAASATSGTISWTDDAADTWNLRYSTDQSSWTSVNGVTENPYTLTGLSDNTKYYVQVQADCGGSQSGWTASADFTTDCAAKSIPWTCGFEAAEGYSTGGNSTPAPDNCWAMIGANAGAYPYVYVNTDASYKYNGSRSLYIVSSNSTDAYLIFPELDAPLNTLQISFYHKSESNSKSAILTLGYMTDITSASSFNPIGDAFTRSTSWTHEEGVSLASVPELYASTARLAFKVGKSSTSAWYSGIDDIEISELPDCPKPSGVTATNVIYNAARINWSEGSSTNKWRLQYSTDQENWTNANSGNLIASAYFDLTDLTTGTTHYARIQAECEGEWSNPVSFTPQCLIPSGLTVSATTTTTATIGWTANGGESEWNVQYSSNGSSSWTTVEGVTANPYTLEGLTSGADYKVKVAAACGVTYTSAVDFETACATVSSFPWTEDFESKTANTIAKCWDISASETATKSGSSSYYVWGVYSYGGNKMLRMYNYMVKNGIAVINSPSISLPTGTAYELSFDYSNLADCGDLKVKISKDGGSTFTEAGSYANASSTNNYTDPGSFTTATVDLKDYKGETIIIQFYALANYNAGAIFVDNLVIQEKPSCPKPTGVSASSVTAHTASVSWTNGGSETAWKLQLTTVNPASAADGDWADVTGTITNPFTLTELAANTTYYARVKADCGGGDESIWSNASAGFTTECDKNALGWKEGFEDGEMPGCWSETHNGSYGWSVSANAKHRGSYSMCLNTKSSNGYPTLVTPTISITGDAMLEYWHMKGSNNTITASVQVFVDGTKKREKAISAVYNEWNKDTLQLFGSNFVGKDIVIKFVGTSNGSTKYLYIDDIRVARTVAISDAVDNASQLAGLVAADETLDVLMTRSLQMDGDYNPLCLPFSLSAAQLAEEDCPLNNCKIKVFDYTKNESGEAVIYIAGASSIEAGVPYFVSYQGTPAAATTQLLFKDVKVTTATAGLKVCDNITYQGNFSPSNLSAPSELNPASLFIGDNNTIYYPNANVTIKGFRGYFTIDYSSPSPAPIRRVRFATEQEAVATGVADINGENATVKRVENNQVVIIREGVKYTILGQPVR